MEPQGAPRTRRDNTVRAGDLRLLPSEAHAELRTLYSFLERTFGLPDVDLTGLLQPPTGSARLPWSIPIQPL
eukprot:5181583-Pyramimonas_sp.AAC.1